MSIAVFTVMCSSCGNTFESEQLCRTEQEAIDFENKMRDSTGTCGSCHNKEYVDFFENKGLTQVANKYR